MSKPRKAAVTGPVFNQPGHTIQGDEINVAGDLNIHLDLAGLRAVAKKPKPHAVYAALGGAALYPFIQQAQAGNVWQAMTQLTAMIGGGTATSVLGSQLFSWMNRAKETKREDLEHWLGEHAAACRDDLNAILAGLEAIEAAKRGLSDDDRQWFVETLRQELTALGCPTAFAPQLRVEVVLRDGRADEQVAARRHYLDALRRGCRLLPLSDLGRDPSQATPITLDQVYIELGTTTPKKEKKAERDAAGFVPRAETLSAQEAAAMHKFFVLLGDPGAGKSSFVRQLLASLADAELDGASAPEGFAGHPLPLYLELRNLVGHLTGLKLHGLSAADRKQALAGVIRQQLLAALDPCGCASFAPGLTSAFDAGDGLLVLDGLDEVAEKHRALVREAVLALRERYKLPRFIVTCRRRSYERDAVFAGIPVHTLAPLDEPRIATFAKRWYEVQAERQNLRPGEAAAASGDALCRAATADKELRALAGNPMLLTCMAIVHQQDRGLPRERVKVYARAVELLLKRWPAAKGKDVGEPLSPALAGFLERTTDLVLLMRRLAFVAHEHNEGAGKGEEAGDLPRPLALATLEKQFGDHALANEFLDYIDQRAGLLVGRCGATGNLPATYAFVHRTFQEYLAGCHLICELEVADLRTKLGGGDYWYLAAQFGIENCLYNEPCGRKLIAAYPADLCPDDQPVGERDWRCHLVAAYQVVLQGGDQRLTAVLASRLVELLARAALSSPIERAEAGRLLAKLGDPRFDANHWRLPGDAQRGFIAVLAGRYWLDDETEQPVQDGSFFVARWPVTNAQFSDFVKAGGYRNRAWWNAAVADRLWDEHGFKAQYPDETIVTPRDPGEPFNLPNHPAVRLSWYEAKAYAAWLTERLRSAADTPPQLAQVLAAGGCVRLPTEAEWVRTARGDTQRYYPWGDHDDPNCANYDETGIQATSAVGCFPGGTSYTNPGVEELAGNVLEWCMDELGAFRVVRGGGWILNARHCRSASRSRFVPSDRGSHLGCRLVLAPCSTNGPVP